MIVKAYKSGKYRLRVTVPKSIFEEFVKYNAVARGENTTPYFTMRIKNDNGEPYFSNCDFGLELDLQPYFAGMGAMRHFVKSNYGVRFAAKYALNVLGLVHGMQLDCKILDRPTKQDGIFHKIIGFTIVR